MSRQDERARRLGFEDAPERLRGLVLDTAVVDDAGAVDDAVDPAVLGVETVDEGAEGVGVADVELLVAQLGPGGADPRDGASDLARGEDLSAGPRGVGRRRRLALTA